MSDEENQGCSKFIFGAIVIGGGAIILFMMFGGLPSLR